MAVTPQQWFSIVVIVVGAATAAFAALGAAHVIDANTAVIASIGFGFVSSCLGGIGTVLFGQGALALQLSNTKGVEPLQINKDASQALAKIALDPAAANVDVKPADAAKVSAIAKGA